MYKILNIKFFQEDYPHAEALQESESNNKNNIDNIINNKQDSLVDKDQTETNNISNDADKDSDNDNVNDNDNGSRVQIKLPLELELDAIANAILASNQQAKMNCVVERRRAEEVIDSPAKSMKLPFGLNVSTDPKKKTVTGERLVIMCESGSEEK